MFYGVKKLGAKYKKFNKSSDYKSLNKQYIKLIVFYQSSTVDEKKSKHSSFDLNTVVYKNKEQDFYSTKFQ